MSPTFEILSLGDAHFLYTVINAVSGINSYGMLGALGAMLGLVMMAVQGMTANGGVTLDGKWILISILTFWVMFIPRVDGVLIVELNTPPGYCGTVNQTPPEEMKWWTHGCAPRTYVVDNVPLGLAATGYIVSTLGAKISELFETSFGQADDEVRVTTGALGQHLRLLSQLRLLQQTTFNDPQGNLEWVRNNLATYMHDCTVPAVSQRKKSISEVMNGGGDSLSTEPLAPIRYAHARWPTRLQVRIADHQYEEKDFSCASGWDYLNATLPNLETGFMNAVSPDRILGTSERPVSDIFAGMSSNIAQDMQRFMASNMIAAVASRAAIEGPMNSTQTASVMMVEEAASKRAMQAAAEENIFTRLLRPTVAFFEALFYALSPLMAFLVTTGAFGMKMVFKYLQMTIWVMLWFPLLAIINLYTNMQMEQFVSALGSKAFTPYSAWSISAAAIDYLGTASTLAAATPALAMSLMYGGAVSMSYLAGRLQGSDVIDEGKVTPDASKTAPVVEQRSAWTNSEAGGLSKTGAPLQKLSVSEVATQNVQVADTASQQAISTFSSVLSSVVKKTASHGQEGSQQLLGSITKTSTQAMDQAAELMHSHDQLTRDEYQAYQKLDQMNRASLALTVGTPGKMLAGSGVAGTKEWATLASEGGGASRATLESLATKLANSDTARASVSTALANAVIDGSSTRWGTTLSAEDGKALQDAAQDVVSTSETRQHALSIAQSSSLVDDLDASQAHVRFLDSGGSLEEMAARLTDADLMNEYRNYLERFDDVQGLTQDAKRMMAGLYAFQRGTTSPEFRDEQAAGSTWMAGHLFVDGQGGTEDVRADIEANSEVATAWGRRAAQAQERGRQGAGAQGPEASSGQVFDEADAGIERQQAAATTERVDYKAAPKLPPGAAEDLEERGEQAIAEQNMTDSADIAERIDNMVDTGALVNSEVDGSQKFKFRPPPRAGHE